MSERQKKTLSSSMFRKLEKELEYLKGEGRLKLSRSIEISREEGDLKENSGYDSLQEEQSQHEMRIKELERTLKNSEIISSKQKPASVKPGLLVNVKLMETGLKLPLYIGDNLTELSYSRKGSQYIMLCSQSSPAGKALIGKHVGEKISYIDNKSKKVEMEILDISIYE